MRLCRLASFPIALFALFALLGGGCAGLVSSPPEESAVERAPGVVEDAPAAKGIVGVELPTLSQDGFARQAERLTVRVRNLSCEGLGTGSGFAIDDTTLVTNRHVVAGAERLEVNTWDGRTLQVATAEVGVLGDVAFVDVDGALPLAAEQRNGVPPDGSQVAAVGYPLGGPFTISRGIVIDRIPGHVHGVEGDILRMDAHIEPGNSGGPLLDRAGRVAGIVYAIELSTGFGLAIPMRTVDDLLAKAGTTSVPPCGSE